MTNANLTPCTLDADDDESPSGVLRAMADAFESGNVEGALVAYVTSDGAVKYQTMGALAEKENIGNAVTVAEVLKRRLHMRAALSS
ncbi:hypothetical protein G5A69_09830 [Ralstonia mannitolilytica]|nr:hypothetical protein G5A69_09830 [Ralstonia mannitolilytica]